MNESIGYVVGGGLKEGLNVRLTVSAETVQEGSFVVCDSGKWRYFGLITDLQLGATDPRFADEQTTRLGPVIGAALLGKTLFTTLSMFSTLMLEREPDIELDGDAFDDYHDRATKGEISPRPVKTVPHHHALVRLADEWDVAQIFGGDFIIGHTIEQGHPVGLDLERLVKRSSGIFGATGTGKSFLTRMVLAGVMKAGVASALVFDMHNEYAFSDIDSDRGTAVMGLQDIFGRAKVQVAALGAGATIGSHHPDFTLELRTADITMADILMLGDTIKLNDSAAIVLDALVRTVKGDWFAKFMQMVPGKTEEYENDKGKMVKTPHPDSVEAWARKQNIHDASAAALHRKLAPIFNKPYVVTKEVDPVSAIIDALGNGRHVILGFGQYETDLDYLLVANILTRRIRDQWVERTIRHKSDSSNPAPKPLMICVEEAHKLLSPSMARHTTFGIIARELRKYAVTLLVIDQRPSGIDDEIMSQLGTRITGWLGDEDDIRAVLTGLAGREQLRGMMARLQEKEEVLLLGWGVKMPIPIKSRRYDDAFYDDMRENSAKKSAPTPSISDTNDDLFGF